MTEAEEWSTSIVFHVRHKQPVSDVSRKRLHRLAIDESDSDLRPPMGIATLLLEQLNLRLEPVCGEDLDNDASEDGSGMHDQGDTRQDDEPEIRTSEEEDESEDMMLEENLVEANTPPLQSPNQCV